MFLFFFLTLSTLPRQLFEIYLKLIHIVILFEVVAEFSRKGVIIAIETLVSIDILLQVTTDDLWNIIISHLFDPGTVEASPSIRPLVLLGLLVE